MAATSRRSSEASFDGADGVVWSRNSWTTPPRLHELMRLRDFSLIARPTPPPAEEPVQNISAKNISLTFGPNKQMIAIWARRSDPPNCVLLITWTGS